MSALRDRRGSVAIETAASLAILLAAFTFLASALSLVRGAYLAQSVAREAAREGNTAWADKGSSAWRARVANLAVAAAGREGLPLTTAGVTVSGGRPGADVVVTVRSRIRLSGVFGARTVSATHREIAPLHGSHER